jgi:hypothetical protein
LTEKVCLVASILQNLVSYTEISLLIPIAALYGLFAVATPVPAGDQLDQGYRAMYNLDFDSAHKAFHEWEGSQPEDPFGPASDAAAYLFFEFERMKVLRSEFFAEDKSFFALRKPKPDPELKKDFENALGRSQRLSEEMLKRGKTPERAMFASVVCTALHADYLALIEKDNWQALNEVKDARNKAEALVAKYPEYKDAYLAVGVENYILSQKAAPVRIFLRMTGAQTDKDVGVQKLRIVAEQGHYLKPYAKILLAIAALRDKNRTLALRLMTELAAEFPGNDLFKQEITKLSCSANC